MNNIFRSKTHICKHTQTIYIKTSKQVFTHFFSNKYIKINMNCIENDKYSQTSNILAFLIITTLFLFQLLHCIYVIYFLFALFIFIKIYRTKKELINCFLYSYFEIQNLREGELCNSQLRQLLVFSWFSLMFTEF